MLNRDEPPETLSKTDAAKRLGISLRTLHRLLRDGELDAVPDGPKGGLRPTRASVERRIAELAEAGAVPQPRPADTRDTESADPRGGSLRSAQPDTPARRTRTGPARLAKASPHVGRAARRLLRRFERGRGRTARALIAVTVIGGLIVIGSTREMPGQGGGARRVTVLLISSKAGHDRPRRIRLRCRVSNHVPLRVRLGRRPRCSPLAANRRGR